MQELTYNVINGGNISMWRDIPATITITGVEDTTGTWKLLIDTDFIDGVVLTGNVSVDNNALVAVIEEVNTTELRNAIRGKKSIQAKATLTNDTNQVYLFPITIKNRGMEGTPTPIQDYYTKTQTDNKFALKTVVDADIYNLAENYWTKTQVAEQIANIEKLGIQVVQTLPPASEGKQFTVYLVPITGSTNNVYEEYLLINGEWQLIGTTAVDLSNYVQKTGFTLLNGKDFIIKNTYNQNVFNVHGYGGYLGLLNSTTNQGGAVSIGTRNSAGQYTVCIGSNNSSDVLNGNNQLFGQGNKTTTANHTILGRWNEDNLSGVNVCISNGNADDDRSNAVLFKTDKTIEVKQDTTFDGTVQFPNNFYFNTQGRIWTVNNTWNVFLGTSTQTWIQNKTMQIGCSNTTGAAIYVICPTDDIYYNNHQKNTAGGFVIQNANGVIAGATDVSITYNNETVTLSSLIARIEALQQQVQQLLNN